MNAQTCHDPGALNHRITLSAPAETPDGCGGLDTSWRVIAHVWAKLQPKRNRVDFQAQQSRETFTHNVTIRYRDDIASGWRIQLGHRHFEVLTIHDPDERRRYLVCETREEGR